MSRLSAQLLRDLRSHHIAYAFDLEELGLEAAAARAWDIAAALTDAIEADTLRSEEA